MTRGVTISYTTNTNHVCPKCAGEVLTNFTFWDKVFRRKKPKAVRRHIKNCKSKFVEEMTKALSGKIDKYIIDQCYKEVMEKYGH